MARHFTSYAYIDTGQITPQCEKNRPASPDTPEVREVRKKLRLLRQQIDEYLTEGKDISPLQMEIEKLKSIFN